LSRFNDTGQGDERARERVSTRDGAHDPAHDTELAKAVRLGNAEALDALFTVYYDELLAYAMSIVADRLVAEDVLQDVFLRIWKRRSEWMPEGNGVARYFYGAVRNRALNMLRDDRRSVSVSTIPVDRAGHDAIGTTALEATELATLIAGTVAALPERCREVFTLSRYQRLSQRDIADLLGITVNTVNVQLGRALRAIRAAVQAFGSDGRSEK
jgi:RNA polymerase sigma-70 factor (ECF subfamily)